MRAEPTLRTIERPNEPCVNCGCTRFVCTECGGVPFEETKAPAQKASEQPWHWQMCKGCGNEPNACTCDTQSEPV